MHTFNVYTWHSTFHVLYKFDFVWDIITGSRTIFDDGNVFVSWNISGGLLHAEDFLGCYRKSNLTGGIGEVQGISYRQELEGVGRIPFPTDVDIGTYGSDDIKRSLKSPLFQYATIMKIRCDRKSKLGETVFIPVLRPLSYLNGNG